MYEELIKKKAFEVEYMFQNDPETDADLFFKGTTAFTEEK